jgi:hypothetical protein
MTQENLDGTYFFNDNLGVTASFSHGDVAAPGPDTNGNVYGISGAYRFASHPITLSLGYSKGDLNAGDINMWHIGFAWDFGSDSLHDRATHGPGWNGANTLYNTAQTLIF